MHTTIIPIHITPHHMKLSAPLNFHVHEKITNLAQIHRDILGAEVIVRRHHGTTGGRTFSASTRLVLSGQDIHAHAVHEDLYVAIAMLANILSRRLRKRKTALIKKRRTALLPVEPSHV